MYLFGDYTVKIQIFSIQTKQTSARWRYCWVFILAFEQISPIFLVFLSLTLNNLMIAEEVAQKLVKVHWHKSSIKNWVFSWHCFGDTERFVRRWDMSFPYHFIVHCASSKVTSCIRNSYFEKFRKDIGKHFQCSSIFRSGWQLYKIIGLHCGLFPVNFRKTFRSTFL